MSKHERSVRLHHMLDSAQEAIALSKGRSRADLDTDRLLNLSLVRLLEILGEAANRISKEEQALYSEIPWSQVISLRNRLIHGYDAVDFDILWAIVTKDLPPLVNSLLAIVAKESSSNS